MTTEGIGVHTKRLATFFAAAVAATVILSACSNDNPQGEQDTASITTTGAATPSPSAPAGGDTQAQAHNDTDVAFAQGMIPHHQQAIEMTDMLMAKEGIDPRVVSLANQIKGDQGPEIQQLQGWLDDWGLSTTTMSPGSGMPGMPDHDMGDTSGSGMMSEQDMAALRDAQGVEASRLFLTQMIEHHKGAIAMSQTEVDSGQFPAAIDLARKISASQQQEIDAMQQLLGSL